MPSRRQRRQTEPVYLATGPSLNPAPLGRPATVVRDRGDVADRLDLDAGRLQRADRGLAPAARALDAHVAGAQARLLGGVGAGGRGLLRREGRPLARALEAERARARPGDHVALEVGD